MLVYVTLCHLLFGKRKLVMLLFRLDGILLQFASRFAVASMAAFGKVSVP